MPCNQLAVQAAQLKLDERIMGSIFGNALALQAIREQVAAIVGVPTGQVSVWNDGIDWWNGYGAQGQADQQTVPLGSVARSDARYIDVAFANACFRVYRDGRIETRDGWRVGYQSPDVARWQEQLAATMQRIGVMVTQNAVVEALRAAGVAIESDTMNAQGRIVVMEV